MNVTNFFGKLFFVSSALCLLSPAAGSEERAQAIPVALIASDGIIPGEASALSGDCGSILNLFEQKPLAGKDIIDENLLLPAVPMSCQKFQNDILKAKKGVIAQSIRLTETCTFPKTSIQIAAPNISLDCKNSVFTGGQPGSKPSIYSGLSFSRNEADSKQAAAWLPVINNVRISNCRFENYGARGITIGNRFNTKNPLDREFLTKIVMPMQSSNQFDLPGKPSPIDEIRRLSPSRISIQNVHVRNVGNVGVYVQDSVNRVDISGLKVSHSKLGVYLDSGSREVTVRNSCFLHTSIPDPRGSVPVEKIVIREAIAIDASAMNHITNNLFYRPHGSSGGIYLYKNCWERFDNHEWDPNASLQLPRRQQANQNKIENNIFVGGKNGVSVAHRQWKAMTYSNPASNSGLMRCGDPYVDESLGSNNTTFRTYADYSQLNQIRGNTFFNLVTPVLLQDDQNTLESNFFRGSKSTVMARIGHSKDTKYRGRAVKGNLVSGNISYLRGIFSAEKLIAYQAGAEKTTTSKSNSHKPATTPPQPGDLIVDFSCAIWNNNNGCKKSVSCPSGRRLTAVRAACDLEQPKVSNAQVDGTAWNQLRVVNQSGVMKDGSCSLSAHGKSYALSSGSKAISLSGASSIEIFCKEKDSNGGDCEIQGQLRCE